jgi:peptidoglycan/xylan/chitin deacetylase (PgdA/CDA1 family)
VRRGTAIALASVVLLDACIAPPEKAPHGPAAPEATGRPHCSWPNGEQAAVSLTYDDALASQLKYAVPVLERAAIKATFFLSGSNLADFAALARRGHELASHTVRHPCNADLAALSLDEMASELDAGNAAVQALGVSGKLTFAYPCGQTRVKSSQSYVPLVKQRFRAARGVAAAVAAPESVDLFDVPAFFPPPSSDGADVIAFIQRAEHSHGWAVIGVHGVSDAGEYLQLAQPVHDAIIAYVAEHTRTIWTAPFGTVADHVAACR